MTRAATERAPGTWPPWLDAPRSRLEGLHAQRRLPQSLLIHGVSGTGRRRLALWLAAHVLGMPGEPLAELAGEPDEETGETMLGHPDLMMVRPPPEKSMIPVESIRELIAFMQLTSHQGGARVAVIYPADRMTLEAANALLKTLEEPPAAGTILLVAAAPARLPPTVRSRCQRLHVPVPARAMARDWLAAQIGNGDCEALLEFAGGAPLQALDWHRDGLGDGLAAYAGDLEALRCRRESPAGVAQRWVSGDAAVAARWLHLQAARGLRAALVGERGAAREPDLQNTMKPTTIPLQRLRDAEELQRHVARSLATAVQFTAVLQRWYGDHRAADGKN
ncbi:MAG: DNA polymerase III subunit delta' [Gammaproteobacteria bacterium]|nr:DNA polymerase III subunit delta' [Gammaproteobacteria bacterium]